MACCGNSNSAQRPPSNVTAQASVNMNTLPNNQLDQAKVFQSANSKKSNKPKRTTV